MKTREIPMGGLLVEGTQHHPAGCRSCGYTLLVPEAEIGAVCPWCARSELEARPALVPLGEPELRIPFEIDDPTDVLATFIHPVRYKCAGLDPKSLGERARRVWFPSWLVDATFSGSWQAELGFDYEVSSARERLVGGRWISSEEIEVRIDWRPHLGVMSHRYDNTAAPGLEIYPDLIERIGDYDRSQAVPAAPSDIDSAMLCLPDVGQDDAWSQARERILGRASEHAYEAARAQHIRGFTADCSFEDRNWTWMLHPVWVTWYEDHTGARRVLYINGQTGQCGGPLMASTAKGAWWAVAILFVVVGLACITAFSFVLGLLFPPLLGIASFFGIAALVLTPFGLMPFMAPRTWNRSQRDLIPAPPT